jgi:hypothetical protein
MTDENKIKNACDEPATLPGPAPYEKGLIDYEHEGKEDLIENLPAAHPLPKPAQANWH